MNQTTTYGLFGGVSSLISDGNFIEGFFAGVIGSTHESSRWIGRIAQPLLLQ
ncbi:hypothetical protein [uncultured Gammaproteobacteria bacterium]|nr:hypothetical protein [uncultured Gammaproteobacteria bacterium]